MIDRRAFLKLAAAGGGAVFASGLYGRAIAAADDFYFVQLSDTHWGYAGDANPEAAHTLHHAVEAVNALKTPPDFIVFTGDLTHTTDDPAERRKRLAQFRDIVGGIRTKTKYFMPGEHDASLDAGAAFQEYFGQTHYTFDHKGVHFIVLDNVSAPGSKIGEAQLAWLQRDLAGRKKDAPIVVFTHRPLFDLVPQWDWATRDGDQAVAMLMPFTNVTVFYGHIHQEHHHQTGHIAHHAAKSLIFPLPAPGSQEQRTPLPWDAAMPFRGLGFREVEAEPPRYQLAEHTLSAARTIAITASKFQYWPNVIEVKRGEPVVLALTAVDFTHGFNIPSLKIRADLLQGRATQIPLRIDQTGVYPFLCDNFCGNGHEEMNGKIVVTA